MAQLEMSRSDVGSDKLFFGYENTKGLHFTRIKSSIEFLLPKVVFVLPKDEVACYCALRLGALSTCVFCGYWLIFIVGLVQVITGNASPDGLFAILIFILIFWGLIWLELKLTATKIKKAIAKQQAIEN